MPIDLQQPYAVVCAALFDRLVELQAESRVDDPGAPVSSIVCMDALLSCLLDSIPALETKLTIAATPDGTLMLRWWGSTGQEVRRREYTGRGL